jgi:predicted nucleic acid-binding protein
MTVRFFVDTNVLAYADDRDSGRKRQQAQSIIQRAFEDGSGVVSHQVLRELYVVATRKLGLAAEVSRRRVELYARLDVVGLDVDDLLSAIDLTRLHSLSLWDALIVQAAQNGGCSVIYSEDLQHGYRFAGLEVINPFREAPG